MPEEIAIPPPPKPEDFGTSFVTPKPAIAGEPSLAPMTERAAAVSMGMRSSIPKISFTERNVEPGVPLDTETGIPTFEYFRTRINRLKDDQVSYLKTIYGDENVRLADTGDPIVRVMDSTTGKPKDVTLAPDKLSLHDIADLGTHGLEIVGGFLAARKGDVKGLLSNVKNIGRMAVGTEAGGAATDVIARGTQGQPMRFGEILQSRGEMVPLDFGGGLFMAGTGKVLGKVISPFSDPMPAQFDLIEAKARLRAKYPGIELPNTPGELTGNTLLLRAEAFARQKPGSTGPFQKIVDTQNKAIQYIQDILTGKTTRTAEETGESALEAIGAKMTPLKSEVAGLKKRVSEFATADIREAAARATGLGDAPDRRTLGQAIREAADSLRMAWKKASGYEEFFDNPITQQENISVASMSEQAKEILKSMPSTERRTAVPTGVLDERGVPLMKDEAGREVWREFIPERVLARLQRIASSPDAKLSLNQLKQMRTEVDDDILTGQAVPGVRNVHLKRVRMMLTNAMNEAVDSFGDPAITTEWKRINKSYAENVPKFEQKGIAELFRDPQNPNWIGNDQLVKRAMDDPDVYAEYVKFFGADSPVITGLKRSVAEDVMGSSANPLNNLVDGKTFITNLRALIKRSPQMARDAFGDNVANLFSVASVDVAAKAGEKDIGAILVKAGKVDLGDLTDLLRSGNPTAQQLVELVNAQNKLALEYRNTIKKLVSEGGPLGEKINPSEFVNSFSRQGEPRDIKEIMSLLSDRPDVTEDIRRQTLLEILGQARSKGETLTHQFGKSGTLSAKALEESMGLGKGGATQAQRYRAILGDETWQDLTDLGRFLQPREAGTSTFGTAGRLSAGSQIAQLERGSIFKFLDTAVRNFVVAEAYSSPLIRRWISNVAMTPRDQAVLMNYMVASTPFVEALFHQFGDQRGAEVAAQIKSSIDQSLRTRPKDATTVQEPMKIPEPPNIDSFRRSTNQPAKK